MDCQVFINIITVIIVNGRLNAYKSFVKIKHSPVVQSKSRLLGIVQLARLRLGILSLEEISFHVPEVLVSSYSVSSIFAPDCPPINITPPKGIQCSLLNKKNLKIQFKQFRNNKIQLG